MSYPVQRPRKPHRARNIILSVVGGIIVIIIIATVANGGSKPGPGATAPAAGPSAASASSAAPAKATSLPAQGDDGDFSFAVTGWDCGAASARAVYNDPDLTGSLPSGTQECIAMLKVTNVKTEAQTFFDSNQYAYDAAGHKYSADDNSLYMDGDKSSTQLNPGVSVTAPVPFNIPAGTTITKLELHDSAFSGGVEVKP